MKKISENILDKIYEQRYKEVIRQAEKIMDNQKLENTREEIKKLVQENIQNKEILDIILSKLELLDEYSIEETVFYEKQFYKIGFADGIEFKAEIAQEINRYNKNDF